VREEPLVPLPFFALLCQVFIETEIVPSFSCGVLAMQLLYF